MLLIREIGYIFSLLLVMLTAMLFVWGIYTGYKNYNELGSGRSAGLRYLLLSALGMGLSLFVFLTVENGFTWDILCLSAGLVFTIGSLTYVNDLIQRKTVKELQKRGSATPKAAISKLFDIMKNKTTNSNPDDTEKKY